MTKLKSKCCIHNPSPSQFPGQILDLYNPATSLLPLTENQYFPLGSQPRDKQVRSLLVCSPYVASACKSEFWFFVHGVDCGD